MFFNLILFSFNFVIVFFHFYCSIFWLNLLGVARLELFIFSMFLHLLCYYLLVYDFATFVPFLPLNQILNHLFSNHPSYFYSFFDFSFKQLFNFYSIIHYFYFYQYLFLTLRSFVIFVFYHFIYHLNFYFHDFTYLGYPFQIAILCTAFLFLYYSFFSSWILNLLMAILHFLFSLPLHPQQDYKITNLIILIIKEQPYFTYP